MTRAALGSWRLEYVGSADEQDGCISSAVRSKAPTRTGSSSTAASGAFVLLNKFPTRPGI